MSASGMQGVGDDVGDLGELGVAEAAGGERRGADPHARRHHRRPRVVRHGVLVHRDADLVQPVLGLLARHLGGAQVDEHEVHVGAAGEHVDARRLRVGCGEALGQDGGAALGALLPVLELRRRRQLERRRLGGDHVHERAALLTGEDVRVDLLREVGVVGQDEARARPADRLVHGRRGDVRVRHGARVQARGDEPGEVRHVDPEQRADLVGDRAERCEVELARVRRPAGDEHLGLDLERPVAHHIHVDAARSRGRRRRRAPRRACPRSSASCRG